MRAGRSFVRASIGVSLAVSLGLAGCGPTPPKLLGCNGRYWIAKKINPDTKKVDPTMDCPDLSQPPTELLYNGPWHWVAEELYEDEAAPPPAFPGNPGTALPFPFDPASSFSLEMRGYCAVRWTQAQPPPPEVVSEMLRIADWAGIPIEEDCVENSAQSDEPLHEKLGEQSYEAFLKGAGADFGFPSLPPNKERARVVVIDTLTQAKYMRIANDTVSLTEEFPLGRNEHGSAIWKLMQVLTGHADQPADEITADLALPFVDNLTQDNTNGGHFGTQKTVIHAIRRAVSHWDDERRDWLVLNPGANSKDFPPLVIVAALGAEPHPQVQCMVDPADSQQIIGARSPMEALLATLRHAACHGAIVVAAAGNSNGDAPNCTNPGPMCPAAMATVIAPGVGECQALYDGSGVYDENNYRLYDNNTNSPVANPFKHPLVYTASGADASGHLIATSRPGGNAPVAAMASLAAINTSGTQHNTPSTGTSFAAAALAANMANLLTYGPPELDGPHAMEIVYNSGEALDADQGFDPPVPVDFCNAAYVEVCDGGELSPAVRYISICHALKQLGEQPNANLEQQNLQNLNCDDPLSDPQRARYSDFFVPGRKHGGIGIQGSRRTNILNNAVGSAQPFSGARAGGKVPSDNLCAGNAPFVDPAPLKNPCATCEFSTNTDGSQTSLYMHIGDGYGSNLRDPALVLYGLDDDGQLIMRRTYQFAENMAMGVNACFASSNLSSLLSISGAQADDIPVNRLLSAWVEFRLLGNGSQRYVTGEIPIVVR